MKLLKIILAIAVLAPLNGVSQKIVLQPYNLNFENAAVGNLPTGWYMPFKHEQNGYRAVVTDKESFKGEGSLNLKGFNVKAGTYGSVYQTVAADDYEGDSLLITSAIKTKKFEDSTNLSFWIRGHFGSKIETFFRKIDSIKSDKWKRLKISVRIPENTDYFTYGLMLKGTGSAYFDDLDFEKVNLEEGGKAPPLELSMKQIDNLAALAKAYGAARFFYPDYQLSGFDWERFLLGGVEAIEKLESDGELYSTLNRLFNPIAPAISIYEKGESPDEYYKERPPNALDSVVLSWVHIGVPLKMKVANFSNRIKNLYYPLRDREAPLIQLIDASNLLGRKVKFSARVKANVEEPGGKADLWLGFFDSQDNSLLMKTLPEPITADEWKSYEIEAIVPAEANLIRLGLVLFGEEEAYFDDVKLVSEDGEASENLVKNSGFERNESKKTVYSWKIPESAKEAGYLVELTDNDCFEGANSIRIFSNEDNRILPPEIGEYYKEELSESLVLETPITLFADSNTVLPKREEILEPIKSSKPENFSLTASDRHSRYVILIKLWSLFRHFGLNVENRNELDQILREALPKAAKAAGPDEFLKVLNWTLARINDGQAKAWNEQKEVYYGLPILWKLINDKLIIHKTSEDVDIELGSEVVEINGQPTKMVIEKYSERVNANTDQWRKLKAIAEMKTGEENSEVSLTLLSPSGKRYNRNLKRNRILGELSENRPSKFSILKKGIYYIDLTAVTDRGLKNIVKEFKERFKEARGFVFDLRGFSNLSEDFLGMFSNIAFESVVRKIPVFTKPDGEPVKFLKRSKTVTMKNPSLDADVYFLIDERTGGQAEIIALLAQINDLGKLIGTPTAGAADDVFGVKLPAEYNASIVGDIVEPPSGNIDLHKGLQPDIKATPSVKGVAQGKDGIFEKALELLKD